MARRTQDSDTFVFEYGSDEARALPVSETTGMASMDHAEDEFCPRQISFVIPGKVGVRVTATERDGAIEFVVDALGSGHGSADLRALFFHFDEAKLGDLLISGGDGAITETRIGANAQIDMGQGANLHGKANPFDVGIEFGTPGKGKDYLDGPIHFTLSNAAGNLTLDDFAHLQFGARLTSTGDKIVTIAPAAPKAQDDSFPFLFEDGVADLNSPSKAPVPVVLNVLQNDTDADGDSLSIMSYHGALHGTVAISADGKSILYTPHLDYSGTDSFEYCVSDGNGGQDSAEVSVTIAAVADTPNISVEVLEGSSVYETKLRVTASQTDLDSSEFIDRIEASVAGGLPPNVTITPLGGFNPGDEPDQIVRDFVITFPENQDSKVDLTFTAVSKEVSNGDEEIATFTKTIELDFTRNTFQRTFEAEDRSIWNDAQAIGFKEADFFGPNQTFADAPELSLPVPVPGLPLFVNVSADVDGHFKFGIEYDIEINGGRIDAQAPVEVTMDTAHNVTTDMVQFKAKADILPGLAFQTEGPGGHFILDALLDTFLTFDIGVTIPVINQTLHPIPDDFDSISAFKDLQIVNITDDAELPIPLPFGFQVTAAFPNDVDVNTSSGTASPSVSGNDESKNFLQVDWDIGQAASQIVPIVAPLFNPVPIVIPPLVGTFTPITAEIGVGANFIQNFTLEMQPFDFSVLLEDNTEWALDLTDGVTISNASSHDIDGDGLEYTLLMKPKAQLTNDTEIGINFSWNLDLLKLDLTVPLPVDDIAGALNDLLDLIPGDPLPDIPESIDIDKTLVDLGQSNIPVTEIDILTNQFALQFQSQTSDMFFV